MGPTNFDRFQEGPAIEGGVPDTPPQQFVICEAGTGDDVGEPFDDEDIANVCCQELRDRFPLLQFDVFPAE